MCSAISLVFLENNISHSNQLSNSICTKHLRVIYQYIVYDMGGHQGWVSSGRNLFLPDIRKKLEERGFFHFLPFLPEETWKKVEETPKCQLSTITKFAVKGFLCILIQYYRFGWIFTLNCNKNLFSIKNNQFQCFRYNVYYFIIYISNFNTFFYENT